MALSKAQYVEQELRVARDEYRTWARIEGRLSPREWGEKERAYQKLNRLEKLHAKIKARHRGSR